MIRSAGLKGVIPTFMQPEAISTHKFYPVFNIRSKVLWVFAIRYQLLAV